MKRLALAAATAAFLVPAAPASAGVLTASQAYSVVNASGRAYQLRYGYGYQSSCWRATPWRFSCSLEVYNRDYTVDCTHYLDVISQAWGRQLRTANVTAWTC